ncbi:MAG: hypothetical protein DSZ14_06555, partial [Candidatus Thioglobus sp.]
AEKIYQEKGIEAFEENEKKSANVELKAGPFKCFLKSLHKIQSAFPVENNPIRTALVTAPSARLKRMTHRYEFPIHAWCESLVCARGQNVL